MNRGSDSDEQFTELVIGIMKRAMQAFASRVTAKRINQNDDAPKGESHRPFVGGLQPRPCRGRSSGSVMHLPGTDRFLFME
jgi:hypothetical protein